MDATSQDTLNDLSEQAHEAVDRARQRAQDARAYMGAAVDDLITYIREHPLGAVGMAATAGFILALLLRR